MRKIYRIARTELQTLFYSPIAWLILIVFTFQTCMVFVQEMEGYVRSQALGYGVYSVTSRLYASGRVYSRMYRITCIFICHC